MRFDHNYHRLTRLAFGNLMIFVLSSFLAWHLITNSTAAWHSVPLGEGSVPTQLSEQRPCALRLYCCQLVWVEAEQL